jgi:hypothetical protein
MSVNPNVLELLSWQYRQKQREYQAFLQNLRAPKSQTTVEDSLDYGESLTTAADLWKIFKTELQSAGFAHIVINGAPGSGKSSAARELMHYAHLDGYKLLYTSGLNVLESPLKLRAEAAGSDHVAVCYDDLSYALNTVSSKKGSTFKSFFTQQRHWFNAQVFNVTIGHFVTALPPVLKNASVWLYPHISGLELDFIQKQCKGKMVRAKLDNCVAALSGIQKMLHDSGPKMDFTLYGKQYNGFTWDVHGRIQLAVVHGMPKLYLSQNKYCSECAKIAFNPRIVASDYDIQKDGNGKQDATGSGGDSA